MDIILRLIEMLLHVDKYLVRLVDSYGTETYAILFLVVFLETGIVFTPFLPGDSLLFAAGMISSYSELNLLFLFVLLSVAAILGDSVNYSIGKYFGHRIKNGQNIPFIKPEHVEKTERFYEKYGNKTIVIARFVPIVRTMAPFFAGFGSLNYSNFIFYNIVGGLTWVSVFLFGGHYFGNVPIVKENFSLAIIFVIILSLIPGIFEFIREKYRKEEVK